VAEVGKECGPGAERGQVGLIPCGAAVSAGLPQRAANMCMAWRHLGITCDGTFAEYRVVPAFAACSCRTASSAGMPPHRADQPGVRTFEHVKPVLGRPRWPSSAPRSIGPVPPAGPSVRRGCHDHSPSGWIRMPAIRDRQEAGADHIVNGSKEDVVKKGPRADQRPGRGHRSGDGEPSLDGSPRRQWPRHGPGPLVGLTRKRP